MVSDGKPNLSLTFGFHFTPPMSTFSLLLKDSSLFFYLDFLSIVTYSRSIDHVETWGVCSQVGHAEPGLVKLLQAHKLERRLTIIENS